MGYAATPSQSLASAALEVEVQCQVGEEREKRGLTQLGFGHIHTSSKKGMERWVWDVTARKRGLSAGESDWDPWQRSHAGTQNVTH